MPASSSRSGSPKLSRLLGIPLLAVGAALLLSAALAPTAEVAASAARLVDATWMDVPPLPQNLRELAVRSTIVDRDGDRLATVHDENRILVEGERIPEHVRQAVIATEDQQFHEHNGVDWQAIVRATLGNVRAGEITSGASTITQQLVKNVVITERGERAEQSIERKINEAVYAIKLEERLTKDEILTEYLNTAYFGHGVYGVGTAAEYYWSQPVEDLTVEQAALLAGMLRAPEGYDPVEERASARSRRDIVLDQMAEVGFLPQAEADTLAAQPIELDRGELAEQNTRDPVVDFVIQAIRGDGHERLTGIEALGSSPEERFNQLATGGYTIRTSVDSGLQQRAEEAITAHLSPDQPGHMAVTTVDPQTGQLLALGFGPQAYGTEGADFHPGVPGLGSPGRQTGSAFKAFGLVAALEEGVPPSYTADPPVPYQPSGNGHCSPSYTPRNYAGGAGGQMDLYEATARSSNVFFVHLVDQVTSPQAVQDAAQRMGVPNAGAQCSAVLGTDAVYGVDMASGFGTLANHGERCEPHAIVEIVDRHGEVVYEHNGACEQVVDADVAARASDVLQGPIEKGTASRHGRIGRPAAGKTGTSQDYGNAWFVGYTPQLSTAVWAGREQSKNRLTHPECGGGVTGGCLPTMVWSTFMRDAVQALDLPAQSFPTPPPLPTATVPDVVGMSEEEATATLDDAGFAADPTSVEHHAEAGTVVDQTPAGDTSAPARSAVTLQVSDGSEDPPTMPFLITLSRDEATTILSQLFVEVEIVEVPVDDQNKIDHVVEQSPEHGTELDSGQTVTLEVGRERRADDPDPAATPGADDDADPDSEATPSPSPDEPSEDASGDDEEGGETDGGDGGDDSDDGAPENDAGDGGDAADGGDSKEGDTEASQDEGIL